MTTNKPDTTRLEVDRVITANLLLISCMPGLVLLFLSHILPAYLKQKAMGVRYKILYSEDGTTSKYLKSTQQSQNVQWQCQPLRMGQMHDIHGALFTYAF